MTDVAAGKVPVLKCFEQAWRFLFDHWRLLAPAAVVPALANGLAVAMAPTTAAETVSATGQLTGMAIVAIASVFFTAAVLRKAVRDEFLPPWGLAAGQDEIRLLGVLGCFVGTFILPIVIAGEVFDQMVIKRIAATSEELEALQADPEALNQAVLQAVGQGGMMVLNVLIVAAIILLVFGVIAMVRLSIANAATIGERTLVFYRTWSWSRGNVLRMMMALVITTLPGLLMDLMVAAVVLGMAGTGPAPVQAIAGAVTGFVQSLLSIPAIALGAILYQGLRPSNFGAK